MYYVVRLEYTTNGTIIMYSNTMQYLTYPILISSFKITTLNELITLKHSFHSVY